MDTKKKVVVIGDIFADMLTHIIAYPNCGDGTYGTPLKRNGGGTGGNIAAGLGVLGVDTSIICRLGDDEVGHYLKDDMQNYHVHNEGVPLDPDNASGLVIIAVTPDGERTIWVLANGSAYEKLTPEDVRYLDKVQPDAIFVSGVMMGVHPAEESIFAVLPAWKGRARIYFDPNLRYPPDAVPPEVKASMQKLCAMSDVVLAGQSEMDALELTPAEGQTFIVKRGKEGSYLLDQAGNMVFRALPTEHVALDATGAGDTYAAAFVCAEIEGHTVEEAMRFATVASGISVTRSGARSMPKREEIDAYMKTAGG